MGKAPRRPTVEQTERAMLSVCPFCEQGPGALCIDPNPLHQADFTVLDVVHWVRIPKRWR